MTDEKKIKNYPIIIEKWVRRFMKTMDEGDLEAGDDSGYAPFGVKIIFDGYPRSLQQAKNLDLLLNSSNQKIDYIFFLNVNKETIIERIKKRKILEKRTDDDLDTILKRYDTYVETTRPVLDYYSKNSNFHEIDGTLTIDQITVKIESFLNV